MREEPDARWRKCQLYDEFMFTIMTKLACESRMEIFQNEPRYGILSLYLGASELIFDAQRPFP